MAGITKPCYRIRAMNELGIQIRCMRCGAEMELRDPQPGMPWTPDQFWVCNTCGRHFWTTYPPPNREKAKAPDASKAADAAKAAESATS
jgi:DNA-directed RNA polymerase subunit RPC12/RpoP